MMRRWLALLLCCGACPALAAQGTITPLTAAAVPALLAAPAQGQRILALWSLDCVYCEPNLKALAALQRTYPRSIELVIIATDAYALRERLAARLHDAGLSDRPAWAYADASPGRLNFLLDPSWGGEMPRTLVIHADGRRDGISGALTAAQLLALRP